MHSTVCSDELEKCFVCKWIRLSFMSNALSIKGLRIVTSSSETSISLNEILQERAPLTSPISVIRDPRCTAPQGLTTSMNIYCLYEKREEVQEWSWRKRRGIQIRLRTVTTGRSRFFVKHKSKDSEHDRTSHLCMNFSHKTSSTNV